MMQKIDIRDIQKAIGSQMTVEVEEKVDADGLQLARPVQVALRLTNASSRILVDGRIHTAARLECVRCLASFEYPLDIEVREEFLPSTSPEAAVGPDLSPEELNLFVYDEDRIDIAEVIRQNVIAALPIKPLCREECLGLCALCGGNKNEAACQCEDRSSDPRWAGLEKFMNKQ